MTSKEQMQNELKRENSLKQRCEPMLVKWFLHSLKQDRADWLPLLQRLAEMSPLQRMLPRTQSQMDLFDLNPQTHDELTQEIERAVENILSQVVLRSVAPTPLEPSQLFRNVEMELRPETVRMEW